MTAVGWLSARAGGSSSNESRPIHSSDDSVRKRDARGDVPAVRRDGPAQPQYPDPHDARPQVGTRDDKPLLYYQEDGKAYLVASYGGSDTPPAWYLNLTANPEVEAQIGSARRKYRARTLSAEEKRAVWPKLLAIYPSYADYQKKTAREIPLVELAPI